MYDKDNPHGIVETKLRRAKIKYQADANCYTLDVGNVVISVWMKGKKDNAHASIVNVHDIGKEGTIEIKTLTPGNSIWLE